MSHTPQPLDQQTLFKLTRSLVKRGFYFFSPHATLRMQERNITEEEVIHILTEPDRLIDHPRWDDHYKTFKYKVCGFYSDRSVVLAINFDTLLVVVTVID